MRFLLYFFLPLAAHANVNEIFAELLGRPDRAGLKASYEMRQYESTPMKAGGGKLGLRQHSAEASIPLSRLSDKKWKLLFSGDVDEIRTNARFPNGRPLPNTVANVGAGLSHIRMLEGDRIVGGSFLLGSSGDQPFAAARDFSFQANLVYKLPAENEAAWIFLLSFANNRGLFNYAPLPGFAYFFRASEKLRIAVGLPFFTLLWSPLEKTVFSLSYFPLYNTQAKLSYFLFGPAHVFAQLKYQSKNFFLSDRRNDKERMFAEEAVANVGFAMPLERNILVDASAGYSFDRKFFLGEKITEKKLGQVVRPKNAPYASVRLVTIF